MDRVGSVGPDRWAGRKIGVTRPATEAEQAGSGPALDARSAASTRSAGADGLRRLALSRLQAAAGNRAACRLLTTRRTGTVQRAEYVFKGGSWTQTRAGADEYRKPDRIRWKPPPIEGQTYNSETGMYRRTTPSLAKKGRKAAKVHIHEMKDWGSGWTDAYDRSATAYSRTTGGDAKTFAKNKDQGPHVAALIFKKVAIESGAVSNTDFDMAQLKQRSILLPSAGQNRKLIAKYEDRNKVTIPKERKVALDREYRATLKDIARARRDAPKGPASKRARMEAVGKGLELAAPTTYGHGRPVTAAEIGGKGENRTTAAHDLTALTAWKAAGGPLPGGLTCFDSNSDWSPDVMERLARAWVHVGQGAPEDVSDFSLSSAEEYSESESEDP